jgi:Tfp pilus assembly protein PilV
MKTLITSERGLGLIQVLASLFIVTLALGGLLVSTYYAQRKAVENYHYRRALLAAMEKIEVIRYFNKNSDYPNTGNLPQGFFMPVVIDERNGRPLTATVDADVDTHSDISIAPYVKYNALTVTLTWRERDINTNTFLSNDIRTVTVREDYYQRYK